jgi:hypothetical protein
MHVASLFLHKSLLGKLSRNGCQPPPAEQRPYICFFEGGSERFMETIRASEALKARAKAIRDELTDMLTVALGENCTSASFRSTTN